MTADSSGIKTMGLYHDVGRIPRELAALGFDGEGPVPLEVMNRFDQFHYHGTAAVEAAIAALRLGPENHLLDLGAGVGGPARYAAHKAGCRVTALELQPDLDAAGATLTARAGLSDRVGHVCGDILSGVLDGVGFDALVSMLVFLHIPDRAQLLACCRAALRPGAGIFVEDYVKLAEPSAAEWQALGEKVYCRYLPSRADYEAQLAAAGFEAVEMIDMTASWSAFVAERLAAFRADRARQEALHGQTLVAALDDFYSTVDGLFAGGNLGGVRVIARRR